MGFPLVDLELNFFFYLFCIKKRIQITNYQTLRGKEISPKLNFTIFSSLTRGHTIDIHHIQISRRHRNA